MLPIPSAVLGIERRGLGPNSEGIEPVEMYAIRLYHYNRHRYKLYHNRISYFDKNIHLLWIPEPKIMRAMSAKNGRASATGTNNAKEVGWSLMFPFKGCVHDS
ncbi:hypothetical protein VTL71DRAFT_10567 [Oculimacula yallundae]|uniref:Uncharacterized protein n=1 Tax=Oculimacula yallundae TaxID=86028 RepID=A0ABR4CTY0_9HELO